MVTGETPENTPGNTSANASVEAYDGERPLAAAPATPAEWKALIGEWDEIRQGYHLGDTRARVLECAHRLRASVAAGGPDTALWTLGLVLTGPHVLYADPDPAAEARVREAMSAVVRALGRTPCAHAAHPCDDVVADDDLDGLPAVLEMLARPGGPATDADPADGEPWSDDDEAAESWFEGRMTREVWACPGNLAGFARSFPG
jgi:hypothetical protein